MSERKPKRYKKFLMPNFDSSNVSRQTHASWREKGIAAAKQLQMKRMQDEGESSKSISDVGETSHKTDEDNQDIFLDSTNADNMLIEENDSFASSESDYALLSSCSESTNSDDDVSLLLHNKSQKKENSKNVYDTGKRIMFPASNVSVNDVLEMVTGFSLRHNLSNAARQDMIEMLKLCAGSEFQAMNISNYKMDKILEVPDDKIKSHYYCKSCFSEIYSTSKANFKIRKDMYCPNCNTKDNINSYSENYFLTIDLKYQLHEICKIERVRSALSEWLSISNDHDTINSIRDIKDSELYQYIRNKKMLTINVSTDGARIFHQSKRSMWPMQICINELPVSIRYKNVGLIGIMIVKHEPNSALMNLYFSTFVQQMNELYELGFQVDIHGSGNMVTLKCAPFCCPVDSPARAICQNRIQFNGYYGCSYCYIHGKYINTMCYPFGTHNDELRTHNSHMIDVQKSLTNSPSNSRGVKGLSVLCKLPMFDIVWGFPFDVMHTVELGVTNFLWNLLLKEINSDKKRKISLYIKTIKPPHDVGTLPKDIIKEGKNYKAKDWGCFLLFFSIPIFIDVLKTQSLHHYALLVKCIYILSKKEIIGSELDECESLLMMFVSLFHKLYSESAMRFNVHLLLHAVDSVKKTGPLWANSTYPYESNIHYLKNIINGPKGIDYQIVKKSINIRSYEAAINVSNSPNCEQVRTFCKNLFTNKRTSMNCFQCNGIAYFDIDEAYCQILSENDTTYKKCIYQNTIYTSQKYARSTKWDDSFIELKSKKMAHITDIVFSNTKCYFKISTYTTQQLNVEDINIPHIWKICNKEACKFEVIPIEEVAGKLIYLNFENNYYFCKIPHSYFNL